jgi:hypothetical protein
VKDVAIYVACFPLGVSWVRTSSLTSDMMMMMMMMKKKKKKKKKKKNGHEGG